MGETGKGPGAGHTLVVVVVVVAGVVVVVVEVVVVVAPPPPTTSLTYSCNTHPFYSVFTVLSSCRNIL